MAQAQELINEIQKGLLQWYDFKEDRQALYVGDKSEPLAQMLFEKKLHVVCASLESVRGETGSRNMTDISTISYA